MPVHNRKLIVIEFTLGTGPDQQSFECQVATWNLANNSEDGEKFFTQCPDGEFREEPDPDYALEVTFYSDWRENGISDWLWANDGELVAFQLDHHPDRPAEHVRFAGNLYIKAPNVGGEARTTEQTEVTFQIEGKPDYTRPSDS